MSALEVGNSEWRAGGQWGNAADKDNLPHPKKKPRWGMPPGRRERREKKKKGLNYRELVFLISCLLTCSIRVHDAVCVSKFS